MTKEEIAELCHEVNRIYCRLIGDDSQDSWEDAPDWQKASALARVEFHLDTPNASPSASHESWLAEKKKEGWVYGEEKDVVAKTHPCYVPFSALSKEQQVKEHLFKGIVKAARINLTAE